MKSQTGGVISHYLNERGQYDPKKSETRKMEILHQKSLAYKSKLMKEIFHSKLRTI